MYIEAKGTCDLSKALAGEISQKHETVFHYSCFDLAKRFAKQAQTMVLPGGGLGFSLGRLPKITGCKG